MRHLLLVIGLTLPFAAAASPYRLPLAGCDQPAGCQPPTLNRCYVTAYMDHGGKDWNCGSYRYDGHLGTDFGVGGVYNQRSVVAAADGRVVQVNDGCDDHNSSLQNCSCGGGFGNFVKLQHADGHSTIYGHMAKGSVAVSTGQQVTCGTLLGKVASSGCSTGPHLHFEVVVPGYGSDDPFSGSCGGPDSYWTDQGSYCGIPGAGGCGGTSQADGASFVSETVVDGTQVQPGAAFTKTWTVRNAGTTTWTAAAGYRWTFARGEQLDADASVALGSGESIAPGQSKTWSVPMTAPAAPGNYTGYWRMQRNGTAFGDEVWVQIVVPTASATDGSTFVSETIPDGTQLGAGTAFTKTWTMRNSGTTTWTAEDGYVWAFTSGAPLGAAASVALAEGEEIAPGQTKTWSVAMTAPTSAGTHTGYWRMQRNGSSFGDEAWVQIEVPAGALVNDAAFVSETLPDDTRLGPGATFTKTWTLRNSGTTTWTASNGYRFAFDHEEQFGASTLTQLGANESIAPGQTKTWSVSITAPTTPGTYRGYWQMDHAASGRFGVLVWVQIVVNPPESNDADGDGVASVASGGRDCDDSDPNVYPGRAELCDGVDNDCNGSIDENLSRSCADPCPGTQRCTGGRWGACDGRSAQDELCNGVDDDCDGKTDESASCQVGYGCRSGTCRLLDETPDAGTPPDDATDAGQRDGGASGLAGDPVEGGCGCVVGSGAPWSLVGLILLSGFLCRRPLDRRSRTGLR